MCFLGCDTKETEIGRRKALGSCPYCAGKVLTLDLVARWRLFFLPIGFQFKRRYVCTLCSRRLIPYHSYS